MRVAALNKEAVRIVARRQRHSAYVYALLAESAGKRLSRLLTTTVPIGIKSQVDGSRTVTELPVLVSAEVISHRAGDVVKTGLPQHRVIEQSLDENHFRISPGLRPMQYKPPLAPGKKR